MSGDALTVLALKVVGPQSELIHRVPLAWRELVKRLEILPMVEDRRHFYGIVRDADHQATRPDHVYTYWVSVAVPGDRVPSPVPDGMEVLSIPAQRYATATARGDAEAINATYLAIARWIDEEGRIASPSAFGFERYDSTRQPVTPPYERFDYDVFRPIAS